MKDNSRFGKWFAGALLIALIGLTVSALWPTPQVKGPVFPKGKAQIITSVGNKVDFAVEIAETAEQQAFGLMYREVVPQGTGMVFPQNGLQEAVFWMKNTPSSLDILFVDDLGKIVKIAEHTVPLDLRPITAGIPVALVFEMAAGEASRLGIRVGDKVTWQKNQ